MINRFYQVVHSISRAITVIAGLSLLGIIVLVTTNAITRRIDPIGPILGTYEISAYLAGIVIASTLAYNQVRKANISVEILVRRFSRRTNAIISSIIYLVSVGLYSVVCWGLLTYARQVWTKGELSATLAVIFFPWVYAVALCFALLVIVLLIDLIRSLGEIRQK